MGGDSAPEMVVEGTEIARSIHSDARFILFGDEGQIAPYLARFPRLKEVSERLETLDQLEKRLRELAQLSDPARDPPREHDPALLRGQPAPRAQG